MPDRRALRALAGLATVVLVGAALVRPTATPLPVSGSMAHIVGFAVLAALWQVAGMAPARLVRCVALWMVAALGVEIMQALLTTWRSASPVDFLASLAGAAAGVTGARWRGGREWRVALLALVALAPPAAAALGMLRPPLVDYLVRRAWAQALDGGAPQRPWPGAPARVAFSLQFPGADAAVLVMDSDRPSALAMAPGLTEGGARIGEPGLAVVQGHRNAAFAALETLQPGQRLRAVRADGTVLTYEVEERRIVRWNDSGLAAGDIRQELALATCWPVEGRVPTPLRLLVRARRV